LEPPVVTRVSPSKGREGELLRIYGLHFNAIDGHAGEESCADLASSNSCLPLRGNCVRIGDVSAPVEAVTPTMLVVRWPLTCVSPLPLVVVAARGGSGTPSQPLAVCVDDRNATGD
jgi:hypothetical protein